MAGDVFAVLDHHGVRLASGSSDDVLVPIGVLCLALEQGDLLCSREVVPVTEQTCSE